jgi:hypothetical protein
MKNHVLFGVFLCGFGLLSCSKEEVTPITGIKSDPPKTEAFLMSVSRIPISGVASVWVEIEQNSDYSLHSYAGKIVLKTGQLVEFAAKEQFTPKGKFMFAISWFKINGVEYEAQDGEGPGGQGILSKLNLRLPDGNSLPEQGIVLRNKVLTGALISLKSGAGDTVGKPLPGAATMSKRFAKVTLNGYIVKHLDGK